MQVRIPTHVKSVAEEKRLVNCYKSENGEATSTYESLGWFVLFDGSHEKLFLGHEKPNIKVGQKATIQITFE